MIIPNFKNFINLTSFMYYSILNKYIYIYSTCTNLHLVIITYAVI